MRGIRETVSRLHFFEYAFSSFVYWMDIIYSYKNRIWEDNSKVVAFCFYVSACDRYLFQFTAWVRGIGFRDNSVCRYDYAN